MGAGDSPAEEAAFPDFFLDCRQSRAVRDALPIPEKTGFDCASKSFDGLGLNVPPLCA
jgi:hypothetical protein